MVFFMYLLNLAYALAQSYQSLCFSPFYADKKTEYAKIKDFHKIAQTDLSLSLFTYAMMYHPIQKYRKNSKNWDT